MTLAAVSKRRSKQSFSFKLFSLEMRLFCLFRQHSNKNTFHGKTVVLITNFNNLPPCWQCNECQAEFNKKQILTAKLSIKWSDAASSKLYGFKKNTLYIYIYIYLFIYTQVSTQADIYILLLRGLLFCKTNKIHIKPIDSSNKKSCATTTKLTENDKSWFWFDRTRN